MTDGPSLVTKIPDNEFSNIYVYQRLPESDGKNARTGLKVKLFSLFFCSKYSHSPSMYTLSIGSISSVIWTNPSDRCRCPLSYAIKTTSLTNLVPYKTAASIDTTKLAWASWQYPRVLSQATEQPLERYHGCELGCLGSVKSPDVCPARLVAQRLRSIMS